MPGIREFTSPRVDLSDGLAKMVDQAQPVSRNVVGGPVSSLEPQREHLGASRNSISDNQRAMRTSDSCASFGRAGPVVLSDSLAT